MKKILPLLLVFTGMVNSQTINIPDQSFRLKLIALGIDTSGDGAIQQSEALTVTSLDLKSSNIASLNGLEFFSNLTSLDCRFNQILSFNATALTNLVTLDCSVNRLTTLLVNGLTQLQTLNCGINRLSTLNLSGLNNLQTFLFSSNNFSALNVSGLPNLQSIDLSHNPITSLNSVTGIPTTLKSLGVQGLEFTTLNVSAFPNLETLYCGQNLFTS
jgi:Leucine-rich repeat (LRR) protein